MRIDPFDPTGLSPLRKEKMRDLLQNLANDLQRRLDKEIQRMAHHPLRRVLYRNHPIIGPTPLHLPKNLSDIIHREEMG
jgi:hypothetical protein